MRSKTRCEIQPVVDTVRMHVHPPQISIDPPTSCSIYMIGVTYHVSLSLFISHSLPLQIKKLAVKDSDVKDSDETPPTSGAAAASEEVDKETSKADASLLTKILRTRLIVNKNDVEVQQKNPDSPLYSVKSFEELRL